MAWETRGRGNKYYYRKRRIGSKVVSQYIGAGAVGELAYLADLERKQIRQELRDEKSRDTTAKRQSADVMSVVAELLRAHGYHWHRGEWRRTRS